MKKNSEIDFSIPQRQSPYALLFITGRSLRGLAGNFWPLILVYFIGRSASWSDYYFIFLGAISILISLIAGIASYLRYTFYVDEDEIIINKGVFRRSRISIPFDRIQVVRMNQNVVHRWTGTYGLTIDTAGSQQEELKIRALNNTDVKALKNLLMEKKEEFHEAVDEFPRDKNQEEEILILKHSLLDTLRVGLTQNHFKSARIIAVFFLLVFSQIYEYVGDNLVDSAIENYSSLFAVNVFMILGSIAAIIIASLLVSMVLAILRYYALKVSFDGNYLRVSSGLFNRREQAVKSRRIQLYIEEDNPLRKLIDILSIKMYQPVTSEQEKDQSISIPGVHHADVEKFRSFALQKMDFHFPMSIQVDPIVVARRTIFGGVIPAILMGLAGFYFFGWYCLIALLWIPLMHFYNKKWFSKLVLEIYDEHIIRKGGVISSFNIFTDYSKVQNVTITQTPYQVRHDLCNIKIYTAGGPLSYPYIQLETGYKLRDYLLYRLESTDEEWM